MTTFIKIEEGRPVGYAVTEDNLRALFPHHEFPRLFTPDDVRPLGFGMFEWTQIPVAKFPNRIQDVTPTLGDDGIYYQTWAVVEMTDAEKAEAIDKEAAKVRLEREYRLDRSDWSHLPDTPLTQEQRASWAVYRQALRDVPAQAGFPWKFTWPTQPV